MVVFQASQMLADDAKDVPVEISGVNVSGIYLLIHNHFHQGKSGKITERG